MKRYRTARDQELHASLMTEQCDVSYLLYVDTNRARQEYAELMHAWTEEEQARHRDALMNAVRNGDRYS